MRYILLSFVLLSFNYAAAQTWIDSLDNYAREVNRPPQQYYWTWQNAALLHAMELQYEMMPTEEKAKYLEYVRIAMDRNLLIANGIFPNGVASANGMAFMYRITGELKYLDAAMKVLNDYYGILRTSNGGVSHLAYTPELWDDTVYMIGVYLLAMYRATNDETYILELINQIKLHQEKLLDEESGLWVHGWDGNNSFEWDFCSQLNWPDPITRKSTELWGRGNGWVVVTLSEILNNITPNHPEWDYVANSLKEMLIHLPQLQDEATGHWYQLPVRAGEAGNYIESSCTAMFGYGLLTALKYEILDGEPFEIAVERAYYGLRNNSTIQIGNNDQPYLNTTNVAKETCIGDKEYYFDINTGNGKAYALAVFIIFGRAYEEMYLNDEVTSIPSFNRANIKVYPTFLSNQTNLNISFLSEENTKVQYQIIDQLGRTMQQKTNQINMGENRQSYPITDLQSGQYFFMVSNQEGQILKTIPIVIQ
jgi:unsaturated rhamnogalacturonyl hydrolase